MAGPILSILLVEDNPGDVLLLRMMLQVVDSLRFKLEVEDCLDAGLKRLARERFDLLLLDLSLPDTAGIDTFLCAYEAAPEVPIIVLTGLDDEDLALRSMKAGAEDYLVKGQVDSQLLARSIRYAIERHRLQMAVRSLTLIDDLTGIYNRRGFLTLAEQHLKLATRAGTGFRLVFFDLDGLKRINDSFGHIEGDFALVSMAKILRGTFRGPDILARLGGDEFAAILPEAPEDGWERVEQRLDAALEVHNAATTNRGYRLSFTAGAVLYDPARPCGIQELLALADMAMYQKKLKKRTVAEEKAAAG